MVLTLQLLTVLVPILQSIRGVPASVLSMQTPLHFRQVRGLARNLVQMALTLHLHMIVAPYISAYPWDSGFGTKYANPSTLPTGTGRGVAFSPDGADIAVVHNSSPYVTTYPWSSGFGTKYANPATLPTGAAALGLAFSPDGADIAVAHIGSPYITVYPWSAGFGTKYANPATLPTGSGTWRSI
jgi:hypothetical protein